MADAMSKELHPVSPSVQSQPGCGAPRSALVRWLDTVFPFGRHRIHHTLAKRIARVNLAIVFAASDFVL